MSEDSTPVEPCSAGPNLVHNSYELSPPEVSEEKASHLSMVGSVPSCRSTFKSITVIASCSAANLVIIASVTSISMSLPSISKGLNITEEQLQWIVSAYSLSSGGLSVLFGRLADLYGRKKAFLLGCFIQAAFSLGCGFAKDNISIYILRGLQGCGAAATAPACLGILAHSFPQTRMRSIAFTIFASGAPLGAAVGNMFGSVMTQLTASKWRSVFYLIAGLNFLCMTGGALSIDADEPSAEEDRRVDYLGAFLVTAGLSLIIFVLSDSSVAPNGWATSYMIVSLIVGVSLILMFLVWQWYLEKNLEKHHSQQRLPPPTMKLSMWARGRGRFAVIQFIAFLSFGSFMSSNFWVQLFYQDFLGLTPILTMIRLLPMLFAGIACNSIIALVVGRIDLVWIIVTATVATACSCIFFVLVNPSQSYWSYGFPYAILSVFGADLVFASGMLFVAKVSLPHEQSVAGALFQTMIQFGTCFALSISTIIFSRVRSQTGIEFGSSAPLQAYRAAQWGAFAFGLAGTLLAGIFLRGVGIVDTQTRREHSDGDEGKDSERTMDG